MTVIKEAGVPHTIHTGLCPNRNILDGLCQTGFDGLWLVKYIRPWDLAKQTDYSFCSSKTDRNTACPGNPSHLDWAWWHTSFPVLSEAGNGKEQLLGQSRWRNTSSRTCRCPTQKQVEVSESCVPLPAPGNHVAGLLSAWWHSYHDWAGRWGWELRFQFFTVSHYCRSETNICDRVILFIILKQLYI